MIVTAVDPGTTESAYVVYDGQKILYKGKVKNEYLLHEIPVTLTSSDIPKLAHKITLIEMVASYGMAVGKDIFETVFWIGRFYNHWIPFSDVKRIYRKEVKMHHCNSMKAKDSNIRQALVDKYGKPGTKRNPNPIYQDSEIKMSGDIWSAFAIATMYVESHKSNS